MSVSNPLQSKHLDVEAAHKAEELGGVCACITRHFTASWVTAEKTKPQGHEFKKSKPWNVFFLKRPMLDHSTNRKHAVVGETSLKSIDPKRWRDGIYSAHEHFNKLILRNKSDFFVSGICPVCFFCCVMFSYILSWSSQFFKKKKRIKAHIFYYK